jgi:GNAT superfamily N-acetyltransferase
MSRGSLLVRDAVPEDAEALQAIWDDFNAEADAERAARVDHSLAETERAVMRLETDPSERLLVAVIDGEPVGVAHLRRAPISPIHEEDAVHVGYLHVLSGHRRRGVGKQLLETAADWADEKDSKHIVASVAATARDSNRFLARLGLGQVAVVRACSVASLRCKLAGTTTPKSVITNVIAARRLMRRSRAAS